ncbi:unnamed protein product [Calypogeia fissa]
MTGETKVQNSQAAGAENVSNRSQSTQVDVIVNQKQERKQVVILVVANDRKDTVGVVGSLRKSLESDGDWKDRETVAGVRLHECESRLLVETIPLRNINGRSPVDIARRWISRNGLRRIVDGKEVVVVCVVPCNLITIHKGMSPEGPHWMEIFGLIFKPLNRGVVTVAITEDGNCSQATRRGVKQFMQNHGQLPGNVVYSSHGGDIVGPIIGIRSTRMPSLAKSTIVPLLMPEDLPENEKGVEDFRPWSPERVILFGRTGSGKSTLAQMLTLGKLDPDNKRFVTSSRIRGETKEVQSGAGRGWFVLDTPGFGESDRDPKSSIPTAEVQKRIKRHVKMVDGTFSHYIYVLKKGRLESFDKKLWEFFKELLGEQLTDHFSVVVSDADDKWVQKDRDALEQNFKGCKYFLAAKFTTPRQVPESGSFSQEAVNLNTQMRNEESLRKLEENLASLGLADRHTQYGGSSSQALKNEIQRADTDLRLVNSERVKFILRGTLLIYTSLVAVRRTQSRLSDWLNIGDRITLKPLDSI